MPPGTPGHQIRHPGGTMPPLPILALFHLLTFALGAFVLLLLRGIWHQVRPFTQPRMWAEGPWKAGLAFWLLFWSLLILVGACRLTFLGLRWPVSLLDAGMVGLGLPAWGLVFREMLANPHLWPLRPWRNELSRMESWIAHGAAQARIGGLLLGLGPLDLRWQVAPLWAGSMARELWREAKGAGVLAGLGVRDGQGRLAGSFQAWFADGLDRPRWDLMPLAERLLLPWGRMVCTTYDAIERRGPETHRYGSPEAFAQRHLKAPHGQGIDLCLEVDRALLERLNAGVLDLTMLDLPERLHFHLALDPGLLELLLAEERHFEARRDGHPTYLEADKAKAWEAFQTLLRENAEVGRETCAERAAETDVETDSEPGAEVVREGCEPGGEVLEGTLGYAIHLAFDQALLESGFKTITPWVTLRRAVKDIFLMDEDSAVVATAQRLGRSHGLFVWALNRVHPDEKGHLARFLERFAPRPWEGLLEAEPTTAADCLMALPSQEDRFLDRLVVLKGGILMAQVEGDLVAEGLFWSALAETYLARYDEAPFDQCAHHALDRLLDCGTSAHLILPGRANAFAGPLRAVNILLDQLSGEQRRELHRCVKQLQRQYGKAFKARYGVGLMA